MVVVAVLAAVSGLLLLLFKYSAKSFVAPEERLITSSYLATKLQQTPWIIVRLLLFEQ